MRIHQAIRISILTLCAILPPNLLASNAENWPQWRGPHLNGSTTQANLPATWGETENVAWVTSLPGESGATPIVWGTAYS